MIELSGIRKSFGTVDVLKGIDLHIESNELVSLVGPSGAGKTTLLQIIGSLTRPDQGSVHIHGTNLFALKDHELSRFRNREIGFVFQFHQLLPEFTALENVCIPAFIKGSSRVQAEKEALELLAFLNLNHRIHHKPSELSGGEQQRVAVARALINKPRLLLADEPSGNLDTQNKQELHQLFFKLRDTYPITILIVTHDEHLAEISDRTITLIDGKLG